MPLDPSIPLSGSSQKPLNLLDTASQAFTLKSAMAQSQQVEQQQKDQQTLREAFSDPSGVETNPETGIPTLKPERMQWLAQQNPMLAQKVGQANMAITADVAKKKQAQQEHQIKAERFFGETSGPMAATLMAEYQASLQKNGGNTQQAWKDIEPKVQAANEELKGVAQRYGLPFNPVKNEIDLQKVASGFSKYAEQKLRQNQPETPHEARIASAAERRAKAAEDRKPMSLTGEGSLSPEALTLAVDQYLAGDSTASQGYARNAQMKSAFMNRLAERAKEKGMGGADVAARVAEFQGTKSGQRTLGTRTANIEMAVTEAENVMPIALSASEKVDRTRFPTLNSVLLAAEKGTGGEDVVRLATATNALINIYSRAISPTGTPTVSDKDHAREIISTAYSKGQYGAAVDIMKQEMAAARKSPGQVREGFRGAVTGRGETPSGGGGKRLVFDPATGTVKPSGGEPDKSVPQ